MEPGDSTSCPCRHLDDVQRAGRHEHMFGVHHRSLSRAWKLPPGGSSLPPNGKLRGAAGIEAGLKGAPASQ